MNITTQYNTNKSHIYGRKRGQRVAWVL